MMRRRWGMIFLGALACAGCGGSTEPDGSGPIPVGKVPTVVVKGAQKGLEGVAFDSAIETRTGGVVTYELRGRDKKGKQQSVRVSAEGKVLETK